MSGPNPNPPQDPNQYPQYGAPQQPGQPPQPGQPQQPGQPPQYGQPQQPGPTPQYGQSQQPGPPPQYGQPQQPGQPPQYGQPQQPGQPGGFAQFGQQYLGGATPGAGVPARAIPLLWGTVGAAAIVFIAAFLPWVSFTGGSVSGTGDGKDGWFTLILALIAGGLAAAAIFLSTQQPILPRAAAIGTTIAGVIVTIIAIVDIFDVQDAKNSLGIYGNIFDIKFSVGFGLWLTLLGGIALAALGVLSILAGRRSA